MSNIQKNSFSASIVRFLPVMMLGIVLQPPAANADIDGVDMTGDPTPAVTLTAQEGYISIADGGSVYSWGYGVGGNMQLPGPTLIVTQGSSVSVTLNNALPIAAGNASIVFPGQTVGTSGGVPGPLTQEAPNGGSVTYTFMASSPGTYQYHSGSQPDLQVEMGLYGTLIVMPSSIPVSCTAAAYNHTGACYDREYLYVLSEVDLDIHQAAELQSGGAGPIVMPGGSYVSEYWLMNGRAGPDTMAASSLPGAGVLPHQPYGSLTLMEPGERVLIRLVGAGREQHPFHHHGNHSRVIAIDGNMLVNGSGSLSGPLLFTIPSVPGGTADAIFEWTGKDLGWDIYGTAVPDYAHTCNGVPVDAISPGSAGYDATTHEWCPDHGRELPVTLPELGSLTFGGFWGGSPYLGDAGSLPPGEGGLNPDAGFTFMWHSHTERELVNNDVFPGGMMTMLIVVPPGTL